MLEPEGEDMGLNFAHEWVDIQELVVLVDCKLVVLLGIREEVGCILVVVGCTLVVVGCAPVVVDADNPLVVDADNPLVVDAEKWPAL